MIPPKDHRGRPIGYVPNEIVPFQGSRTLKFLSETDDDTVIGLAKIDDEERKSAPEKLMTDREVRRHHENLSLYNKLMEEDPKEAEEFAATLADPFDGLTDRQKSLVRLRFRGFSWEAAGKLVGLKPRQITTDVKAIKEHYARHGTNVDQDKFVGESITVFEEVAVQAWNVALQKDISPGEKVKALQLVLQATEKQNKLRMDVGILQKATTKHEHVLAVSPWVEKLQSTDRTEITKKLLESQLKELPEPEPLEDGDDELAFARAVAEQTADDIEDAEYSDVEDDE